MADFPARILSHPVVILILPSLAIPTILWVVQRTWPNKFDEVVHRADSLVGRIAARRNGVIIGSAVLVCGIRVLFLWAWPIPQPAVLDEFSYLLMGDTFAAGRLANPPHSMWRHFETLFVLQQPTSASIYPPAHGLFLAAGKWATGTAWWGVWLSVGLMCAAVAWALYGWLPPRWAILGIAWVCLQIGLASYWMNSYWGGAVAAAGGALLAGAAGRMRTRVRFQDALAFSAGAALLANSRPYEGFCLATAVGIGLVLEFRRRRCGPRDLLWPVIVPISTVFLVTALAMGFYFYRVTGSPWKVPQQLYYEQYAAAPAFVWQKPLPERQYLDNVLRADFINLTRDYQRYKTPTGALEFSLFKLRLLGSFYLGPLVDFVPLLAGRRILRGRTGLIAVGTLVTLAAILVAVPIQSHYGSPLTVFFVILAVQGLRHIWIGQRWGQAFGKFLVPAMPVVCGIYILAWAASSGPPPALNQRPRVIGDLLRNGGRHLVIVHYGTRHSVTEEWVYNGADVDASPIVWARDLGKDRNVELFRYYPDRKRWLLRPDSEPAQLVPYPDSN